MERPMIGNLRSMTAVVALVTAACGDGGGLNDSPTTQPPTSIEHPASSRSGSPDPSTDTTQLATTSTTVTGDSSTGWNSVVLGQRVESAAVRFAVDRGGWLVSVSEGSSESPVLWLSKDGEQWSRVAELPVLPGSLGAPLVGIGTSGMVAIRVGDPESRAFGDESELTVWTSADGSGWVEGDPAGFEGAGYLHDLRSTAFGWVVAGEYVVDRHTVVPAIYWSGDGASWRRVTQGTGWGVANAVVAGDGDLIVVGSDGGFPVVWHSADGIRWSRSSLPSSTHGGVATAGAWLDDRWLVVGTGSEAEPMTTWQSGDGLRWETTGQLIEPWEPPRFLGDRFGRGVRAGDRLAVGAIRGRFLHVNFCFETDQCFVTAPSVLLTSDGGMWWEVPAPPRDGRLSDPPAVSATETGDLVSVTVYEGMVTVWSWPSDRPATPVIDDPPVPELTIERAEWGQDLQLDNQYAYVLNTHCGIFQLGEFNGQIWQLEDLEQPPLEGVGLGGHLYGVIELTGSKEKATITFVSGGQVVGKYIPKSLDEMRGCM
jgi:hypothetical protein